MPANPTDLATLRRLLNEHFSLGELHNLCHDLGIDFENLPGDTKESKARELVEYCDRRDQLDDLLKRCQGLRPKVQWPDFAEERQSGNERELALDKLLELRKLLDLSWDTFVSHNEQRNKLQRTLYKNHTGQIPAYKGYDDLFYKMYDVMNDEERELFDYIRGVTKSSMRRFNERLLEWVENNDPRKFVPKSSTAIGEFESDLRWLELHLSLWFAKYENVFLTDSRRSLVYLGDEKSHGKKFPPNLNNSLDAVIAELSD